MIFFYLNMLHGLLKFAIAIGMYAIKLCILEGFWSRFQTKAIESGPCNFCPLFTREMGFAAKMLQWKALPSAYWRLAL